MNLWSNEQIVVSIDGPDGPREIVVPAPLARIGAHPESDVVLSGNGVALRALYLHATSDGLYVLHLDLQDGTLEDRGRWLLPADILKVGDYRLRARTSSTLTAAAGLAELVSRGSGAPLPVLNIYCDRLLKDKRRFRARLSVIGRRPQCSLQLRGKRVSSFHCALYWDERRLWCIDLLSSNGTQRNGVPLRCEELKLDGRLEIGEFELEYHRWSPRRSMAPGWQPATSDQFEEDASLSATDALASAAVVGGDRPADSGSSVLEADAVAERRLREELAQEMERSKSERRELERQRAESSRQLTARIDAMEAESARFSQQRQALEFDVAEERRLRAAMTKELERSKGERLELERQWGETSRQLTARIDALQAESAKLSQERTALEEACKHWEAERASLKQELADRSDRWARLESDVAAANRLLAERTAELESLSAKSAPPQSAEAQRTWKLLPETMIVEQTGGGASQTSAPSASSEQAHMEVEPSSEVVSVAEEETLIRPNAVGRRGKPRQQEMSTFVSDRLSAMDTAKRNKRLVLVAAIGAATLTISAAIAGAWMWLH